MTRCVLALGGNSPDTESIFLKALSELEENGFTIEKVSRNHMTKPVGCEKGAHDFTNACITGFWDGNAFELLKLCQEIEVANGRPREHAHWVSRTLDIDIILFGDEKIQTSFLTVPHPLAAGRDFVTVPLSEIAPELIAKLSK